MAATISLKSSNMSRFTSQIYAGFRSLTYAPHITTRYLIHRYQPTSPHETLEYTKTEVVTQIKNGRSFIRFGDGEAMLMTGRDIYYQPTNRVLCKALRTIAQNYSDNSPYFLGLPTKELRATEAKLKTQRGDQVRIWRLFRILFPFYFSQNVPYAYYALFFEKGWFETNIMPILSDRHVIIATNSSVLTPAFKAYFATQSAQASFVTTPPKNAFKEKDTLLKAITTLCTQSSATPIVLLAAGPASKVLAYDLANQGIQTLDLGHGIESIASDRDRTGKMLKL